MKKMMVMVFAFVALFLLHGCIITPSETRHAGERTSVSELIEQVKPALVKIESTNPIGVFLQEISRIMGVPIPKELRPLVQTRSGSGFLIDPSGVVVTNHHVMKPGWLTVVKLADGRKFMVDAMGGYKLNDIAVMVLQNVTELLPYVKWADNPAKAGDAIFVIGRSPNFDFAYKTGVVSHPARIQRDGSTEMQSTLPVVPGESGSAIFNTDGEVVCVVTSYYPRIQGVSACTPMQIAKKLAKYTLEAIKKEQKKRLKQLTK